MTEVKQSNSHVFLGKCLNEYGFILTLTLIWIVCSSSLIVIMSAHDKFQATCETTLNQAEAASTIQVAAHQIPLIIDGCKE